MNTLKRMSGIPFLAVGLIVSAFASAEPNTEQKRLMQKRDAERYELDTPGSSVRAGAARVTVRAPMHSVQRTISDFKNYPDFISKFEKARIVGRDGAKTDVYLQVPILKGAAKIWAVLRFEPIKTVNGWSVMEARMVKGNVKRLDARWRVKAIDAENTQLNLEMFVEPKLPLPGSVITGESAYAADVAVMGSRDRAEQTYAAEKKR